MSFTKHVEFEEPEALFVVKLPWFGIGRLSVFPDIAKAVLELHASVFVREMEWRFGGRWFRPVKHTLFDTNQA